MTTAPNSLTARAAHMIMPTTMWRQTRGRVTRQNVWPADAPRLRETFSSRIGMSSSPALTVLT